jgi:hypothetical protein
VVSLEDTTVRSHTDMGVVTSGGGTLSITGSTIRSNGRAGIYLGGTGPVVLYPDNCIVGNGQYDVVNMTARGVNARQNYWGVTTRNAIRGRIYDGRDSSGLGIVSFWPAKDTCADTATAAAEAGLAITSATAVPSGAGIVEVTYTLSAPGNVEAEVVNIAGRPIRRLATDAEGNAGLNVLLWDGRSDTGLTVPAGRYVVRLRATSARGEQAQAMATAIVGAR